MLIRRAAFVEEHVIKLDVWLYGPMARYAGDKSRRTHANVQVEMPDGSRMRDLLDRLGIPLAEKSMTFINGDLTDTPGLGADLDRVLQDGDRVAFMHELSMWPFQYRFGAAIGPELKAAMLKRPDGGIFHSSASVSSGKDK